MRKAKLNMRIALCVTVLGAALTLSGCGLGSGGASLTKGLTYQKSGQYRAAYIEAKKVLQKDKNNGNAWVLLGEASLMLGNPNDALSDLRNARKNGAPADSWSVPMAQALLVSGQYQKLIDSVPVKTSFAPTVAAPLQALRGDAYRALKQTLSATDAYHAALKLDTHQARAWTGLARMALAMSNSAAADKYIKKALANAPDSQNALVGEADVALASGNDVSAAAAYQKALDSKTPGWLPQDRYYARTRLADVEVRQEKYTKALANIDKLEKSSPNQPLPHYLHALVLYRQGHFGPAVEQLQQVLKQRPDNVPGQMLMGAVNYAQGNYGQAQMYLSNVMGATPNNVEARKLLALAQYRAGSSSQALDTLRPAIPGDPSKAELVALLQRAVASGAGVPGHVQANAVGQGQEPGIAAEAAGKPGSSQIAAARKALAAGNPAEAIKVLKAMSVGRDATTTAAQRNILLAMAYVRNHQPKDAVAVASAWTTADPRNPAAHQLYGTALVSAGQHDKARAQYLEALKLDPGDRTVIMNIASLDLMEHKYHDAAARYQAVLKKHPGDATAMTALGRTAAMQNNNAEAISWYKQAISATPTDVTPYIGLVMVYSRAGQFDQAADTAKKLAEVDPDNPVALNALGAAELNAGRHAAAVKPLAQAVKLAPDEVLYRINLARAQALNKDSKAAESNLVAALKTDPGRVRAAALLAFLKLQDHDLNGALAVAQELQQHQGTEGAGLSLEGDLYMADKSYDKAARAYQHALKADYTRSLVIKRFQALNAAGDKQPAGVLRDWLEKQPKDARIRLLLAQYYMGHDRNSEAATQYETVLKAHPANLSALNNLAWIYTNAHNPKALSLAKQALKLAPTSPGIMDTYGWALVAAGKPKAALPLLKQAAKAQPKTAAIQYHLAVAQVRTGDKSGARLTLAGLQRAKTEFPERKAADALYRKLGGTVADNSGG